MRFTDQYFDTLPLMRFQRSIFSDTQTLAVGGSRRASRPSIPVVSDYDERLLLFLKRKVTPCHTYSMIGGHHGSHFAH